VPAAAVRLHPDLLQRARPDHGLAEFAAIQNLARHEAGPDEMHDLPDHQFAPAGFGDRNDAAAFGDRQRHRLFQQHVLAGLQRGHRQLAMQMMRGRDRDGVDRLVTQHRAPIAIWLAAMFGGVPLALGTGIGAELGKDDNGNVIVMSTLPDTPAEKSGLRAKDVIAQIDDKSAAGISIEEAKDKIRGPKDTQVKLKVVRDADKVLEFTITRDTITIPSVTSKIMDGNIGYLQITRFGPDTSSAAMDAANKFKNAGVKGVILDVRSDPGGLLDAAVDVSSLWLSDKTVLTERRDGQVVRTYNSHGIAVLAGIPTVVLINEGSASASEITAGALKDNKVASLTGVKSFGKGSVQQLIHFNDDSLLKVTIARWYTPDGKNIDKEGIKPDKEVKLSDDDIKTNKDPQLDAALAQLR